MNYNTISSFALDARIEKDTSFAGNIPNFEKIRQYRELKSVLTTLKDHAFTIRTLEDFPPDRSRRSAMLTLEYDFVAVFPPDLCTLFQRAVSLSDGVTISCAGASPAITFTVLDVWSE